MKKVTLLFIALILSILVSSCASKVSNETDINKKPY